MNRRALLHAEYQRQKLIAHVWGESDCACTAADFVKPIIGRDVMEKLRGTYDSEIGAKRIMIANNWADMGAFAASVFAEIPLAQAHDADWIHFINADGTDGIGVVCGAQFVARTITGVGLMPLSTAKRAFKAA